MNILVLGSGMYVTGRNESGAGTVLASLIQSSKVLGISSVLVLSRSRNSEANVIEAVNRINRKLATQLSVRFMLLEEDFLAQLKELKSYLSIAAAIVSLPDHLHFPYARDLLNEKIHTLVVKPLTPTLTEAKELLRLQEKNEVYGCVELHKRFDETNLYVKRVISEKTLGDLLYITVDYSQRISIPASTFRGWSHQTNIFQYLGVHYVDLIYFLTGARPKRLMAVGMDGALKAQGIDTYDSVHVTLEWVLGSGHKFVSILNISWVDANVSSALSDQKYKVIGTLGRIECDQKNRGLELVSDATGIQHANPYFSDFLPDENGGLKFGGYGYTSIYTFLSDVDQLQKGGVSLKFLEKNRPSFQSAIPATAIVDAVNQSLDSQSAWTEIEWNTAS